MKKIIVLTLFLMLALNAFAADKIILSAIEIGSKGIKAVAVEANHLNNDADELDTKIIYRKEINPTIMSGVENRLLKKDRIQAAAQATSTLFNDLKKFDPQFIVIVASTAFDQIDNKSELIEAIKNTTGKDLAFIKGEDELYFGLLSAVPKKRINSSILIDIGSGNTKIGYATPMAKLQFEAINIPYGTVTLKDKAKSSSVSSVIQSEIIPYLRNESQDKPGVKNLTRTIYILGGASWALSNLAHPEEFQRNSARISFEKLKQISNDINNDKFTPKNGNDKYNAEVIKIFDVFTTDDLKAGGTLLVSILDEINGNRRKIIFPRQSGWIFGYMYARYFEGN